MLRRATLMVVLAVGCDGGTEALPLADAASDTTALDVEPMDTNWSGIPRCGPGPYILHKERVSKGWGGKGPLVGAKVRTDLCPDSITESDANGEFKFAMTRGVPYDLLFDHPELGAINQGTWSALFGIETGAFFFAPTGFALNDGVLHVVYYRNGDYPPPCNDSAGLSVKVEGHPEARVHYFRGRVEVAEPSSTEEYTILVDNLPFGVDLAYSGTKEGCLVRPNANPQFVRTVRAFKGYRGTMPIEVLSLPKSDAGTD